MALLIGGGRIGGRRRRAGRRAEPALRWAGLLTLLLGGLAGCAEQESPGSYRFELYEGRDVRCDPAASYCTDGGRVAVPERLQGLAHVSRLTSRFEPHGLYLYLEFERSDGRRGLLELDAALTWTSALRPMPSLLYEEFAADGSLLFHSSTAHGRIELPAQVQCGCQDGRLELVFTAVGPDGLAGTGDDLQRRLSRLQFSRNAAFCRSSTVLGLPETGLEVAALTCPVWAWQGDGPAPDEQGGEVIIEEGCTMPAEEVDTEVVEEDDEDDWWDDDEDDGEDEYLVSDDEGGCGGEDPEGEQTEEESGCSSSDDGTDESTASDDGGCVEATDTDDPEDYSTDEGCSDSSDSGSSDAGGSGCSEGDSVADDSGADACESTAEAAVRSPDPRRTTRRTRHGDDGLRLSLAAVLLAGLWRLRGCGGRRRRPGTRCTPPPTA